MNERKTLSGTFFIGKIEFFNASFFTKVYRSVFLPYTEEKQIIVYKKTEKRVASLSFVIKF